MSSCCPHNSMHDRKNIIFTLLISDYLMSNKWRQCFDQTLCLHVKIWTSFIWEGMGAGEVRKVILVHPGLSPETFLWARHWNSTCTHWVVGDRAGGEGGSISLMKHEALPASVLLLLLLRGIFKVITHCLHCLILQLGSLNSWKIHKHALRPTAFVWTLCFRMVLFKPLCAEHFWPNNSVLEL